MQSKYLFDGWVRRIARIATPVALVLLWCMGNAVAQQLVVFSGNNQNGAPGQTLPNEFVITVVPATGQTVPPGAQILWSVIPPGTGTFSPNPSGVVTAGQTIQTRTLFTIGSNSALGPITIAATIAGSGITPIPIFTVNVSENPPPPPAPPTVQQTAAVQQQIAISTPRVQIANVQTRLDQLRLQNNPAVAKGLRLSYDGKPLPWQLLAEAVAPAKSDATPTPADPFERSGVFIQGDVEVGHQDTVGTTGGFDLRSKGLTIGIDHRFEGNNVLGAALGLLRADTTLREDGGTQDAKGYSFSLYGSYTFAESGYVNLIGNIGRNDYNGSRNIPGVGSASSSTNGTQYGIALGAGYDFYRDTMSIGPYGRVEYVNAKIDSFTETGVTSGALTMGEQDTDATFLALGGQVNWAIPMSWGVLQPNARLEWQYQTSGNSNTVTANFGANPVVPIEVAGQDKSYGVGSVGIQLILPYSIQAYFNFEAPFGRSNYSGQRYTLGVRVGF